MVVIIVHDNNLQELVVELIPSLDLTWRNTASDPLEPFGDEEFDANKKAQSGQDGQPVSIPCFVAQLVKTRS